MKLNFVMKPSYLSTKNVMFVNLLIIERPNQTCYTIQLGSEKLSLAFTLRVNANQSECKNDYDGYEKEQM